LPSGGLISLEAVVTDDEQKKSKLFLLFGQASSDEGALSKLKLFIRLQSHYHFHLACAGIEFFYYSFLRFSVSHYEGFAKEN